MNKDDEIKKLKDYDNLLNNIHKKRIKKYVNYKKLLSKLKDKDVKQSHRELIDKKNNVIQIILDDLKKKIQKI